MISMTIPKVKIQFFGRAVIKSNWDKLATRPISRFGMIIRGNARSEIGRQARHKTKPRPSPKAPRSRNAAKPFKLIFSSPGFSEVVVGMVGFGGPGTPVPGLHEHGGTVQRNVLIGRKWKTVQGRKVQKAIVRKRTVRYPIRQFMQPAYERALPKLPAMLRGTLNKG